MRGFCVGVALSGFPVGLPFYFLGRWQGKLGVELARLIILFGVVRACATFCLAFMGVCLGVAGGNLCWARAVSFLFRFGPTQFRFCWGFACVLLLGFPAGLSQLFVRAVVTGKFFVGLARQIVCVLRWARASWFWSSAFGVLFWVPACCFLFERWRQVKCFV